MSSSSIRDSSWYVQVPLNDLLSLQNMVKDLDQLRNENAQLKRQIEGVHRTVYELMGAFNDYKKGVPVRRGA